MPTYHSISESQQRILTAELLSPGLDQYVIKALLRYENASAETLQAAVRELIEKDADINIRFRLEEDGLSIRRYRGEPAPERIRMIDENDDWRRRFDFDGPVAGLWDAPLYEFFVSNSGGRLFVKIHHAITDGGGCLNFGTLLQEILDKGKIEERPALYDDYVGFENDYFSSEKCEADRDYWES